MIGSTIVHLDIVDSTNNYAAKELLTKSLNEGTVFVATCQQSGKGQGQSSWESAAGLNLTFSIVLFPTQLELTRQFLLSMAIALGITDFLSGFMEGVTVKWPNDIYAGDQKIAGILIETSITAGEMTRAIVGIGLNINQEIFNSDAPNPVSMKNLTGIDYDLGEMLAGLCEALDKRYLTLLNGDFESIHDDYEQSLYRRGIWTNFRADGIDFEGMIKGVGKDGKLMIETMDGAGRGFYFKEVLFK